MTVVREGTGNEDLAVPRRFHGRGAKETCDDRPLRCDDAERSIVACPSKMVECMAGSARIYVARTSNLVEIEMEGRSGVGSPSAVSFRQYLLFDPRRRRGVGACRTTRCLGRESSRRHNLSSPSRSADCAETRPSLEMVFEVGFANSGIPSIGRRRTRVSTAHHECAAHPRDGSPGSCERSGPGVLARYEVFPHASDRLTSGARLL